MTVICDFLLASPWNECICQKLAVKVMNGDHVTMGQCNCHKCPLVAKRLNHNHMTTEMLQQLQFQGPVVNH